jgi:hypothetical protein
MLVTVVVPVMGAKEVRQRDVVGSFMMVEIEEGSKGDEGCPSQ